MLIPSKKRKPKQLSLKIVAKDLFIFRKSQNYSTPVTVSTIKTSDLLKSIIIHINRNHIKITAADQNDQLI